MRQKKWRNRQYTTTKRAQQDSLLLLPQPPCLLLAPQHPQLLHAICARLKQQRSMRQHVVNECCTEQPTGCLRLCWVAKGHGRRSPSCSPVPCAAVHSLGKGSTGCTLSSSHSFSSASKKSGFAFTPPRDSPACKRDKQGTQVARHVLGESSRRSLKSLKLSEEDSVQWSSGCCCRPGPRPSQGWQASRACAAVGSGGVGKVGLAHRQPQATLRTQHPNPVMLLGPCCWASTATPLTHPHTAAPDPCTAAGRCAPWHLARGRRGAGSTWGAC